VDEYVANNEYVVVSSKMIPLAFDAWNTFFFKSQRYKNTKLYPCCISQIGALFFEE
jgi:hypothetical protein